MRVFTVTLNTAIDAVVSEKDYNETELSKAETIPAGKGLNVSRALKSADISSTVIALVGEDDINFFKTIEGKNIETIFVPVPGKTRINVTVCSCEDGLEHHERKEGYSAGEEELAKIYNILLDEVCETDWVIFSGSLPPGMPKDAYARLINLCKMKGAYTTLDSSGAGLLFGLQAGPYAIKPNREELEEVISDSVPKDEELHKVLRSLSARYDIRFILTTFAKEGALLYVKESDEIYKLDAFRAMGPIVSSVGCGDSAVAGLVSGFLNFLSYEECLKESMLFANANLYTMTPGDLKWEE